MKKIIIITLLVSLFSCESDIKGKYKVIFPDKSGQILRVYHTDNVEIKDNTVIFIPYEDSLHKYEISGNWSISRNR